MCKYELNISTCKTNNVSLDMRVYICIYVCVLMQIWKNVLYIYIYKDAMYFKYNQISIKSFIWKKKQNTLHCLATMQKLELWPSPAMDLPASVIHRYARALGA